MKKYTSYRLIISFLIISFLSGISLEANAQRKPVRKQIRERIEARHAAFITEKVNLTPEEAAAFWPVYHEFAAKRKEVLKQIVVGKTKDPAVLETMSDKELLELADAEILKEQRMLDLRKEYHAKFKAILPPLKLMKFYEADKQFKKMLLKRLREFKNEG